MEQELLSILTNEITLLMNSVLSVLFASSSWLKANEVKIGAAIALVYKENKAV
jgi:hypothetical protein